MVRVWMLALVVSWSTNAISSQDPTAPLGWEKPKAAQTKSKVVKRRPVPTLQSIVCAEKVPCRAVLNDQVVVSGEHVNGYRINKIEPEVVTISRNGKQWKLELFSLEVKK